MMNVKTLITWIIIVCALFTYGCTELLADEDGFSTLPGWSAGYKFSLDMDKDEDSKLRMFGKYKEKDGTSYKLGWDKKTGTNLNDWNEDEDGVIFFEQEIKF